MSRIGSGWAIVGLFLVGLVVSGCGGASRTNVSNRLTSPAQESADLARAYQAGLLSADEYQDQKRRLGLQ